MLVAILISLRLPPLSALVIGSSSFILFIINPYTQYSENT